MDLIESKYAEWLSRAVEYHAELAAMDAETKKDAFYKDLEFGTAGLRGVLGAGTNRLNLYTIGGVTQGLADYLLSRKAKGAKVAISYDSRNFSTEFARHAAAVLAQNGITVYITKELKPTPYLSFLVRHMGCDAGVMITASHNPAKFNGYKVYGADGCQVTDGAAADILGFIQKVNIFDVKAADFDGAVKAGNIVFADVTCEYLNSVYARSVGKNRDVSIVYTPLNGTGCKIVPQMFGERGFSNVIIVPEQAQPNGDFPTTPYPNPEKAEALKLAIELAKQEKADIVIGTDPDADRIGAAVRLQDGEYRLISGNEMGVLLIDYIFSHSKDLPKKPVVVKTIVTTDLAARVAEDYGAEVKEVLTGFKYIGEVIKNLEKNGEGDRFVFGYEESYGYLSGTYVRDKDAVVASMLVAEMAADYKAHGKTLGDVLDGIYAKYGRYYHRTVSFTYEGVSGAQRMKEVLSGIRKTPPTDIDGSKVVKAIDYSTQTEFDLPKSDVLSYKAEDGSKLIIRPSGTEPLIKVYITAATGGSRRIDAILNQAKKFM
ncbi:MAG: phospho-sugar mutase [Clostridiales bacterium]|nr:phospho-sugar mutase [Clostridiales bacterium]